MADFCLTLTCPPALEERLFDTLLEELPGATFTSSRVYIHGAEHEEHTALEQVLGRSRSAQVEVLLAGTQRDALFGRLRAEFAGTPLHYRITRVDEEGGFA